jgi:crotonobetainyl-CoA:carnitine CoA-transferase CaiB-like acyl-CoA transferase
MASRLMGMLDAYRVLDLTDARGLAAGRWLADLGADVIQVEAPGGSAARYDPSLNGEGGSYWSTYAHNKRGITCNLDSELGRQLFVELCRDADFLIESAGPGAMAAMGLSYEQLAAVNPRLIYVSISAFGSSGPKAAYADDDLVVWAAAGALYRNARDGRPPVRVSAPMQAYLHAAADAVTGALLAHLERASSGQGQRVEISAQQSATAPSFKLGLYPMVGATPPGAGRATAGHRTDAPAVWDAADGPLYFVLTTGPATGSFSNRFLEWLRDEGVLAADFPEVDFRALPQTSGSGLSSSAASTSGADWAAHAGVSPEQKQGLYAAMGSLFSSLTTTEVFEAAIARRLLISPIYRVDQISQDRHLAARGFWWEADGGADGTVRVPGPLASTEQGMLANQRPAPNVGEHNAEVYSALAWIDDERLWELAAGGVL